MARRTFRIHIALAALALTTACDAQEEGAKSNAAPAARAPAEQQDEQAAEEAKARAAEDAKAQADAAKTKDAEALLPKLYERTGERKTKAALIEIGAPAIEPVSEELKVQIVGFALAGSGSKEAATKKLDHMHHANLLIEILKEIGDDGVSAAKKVLDEIPEADQKQVADMFRARHDLFD